MGRTLDSTLRLSGTSQNISVAATSAAVTNVFGPQTFEIRVVSTTNCWIKIGDGTPTAAAAAGSTYLPASVVEYFHVSPGQRLAAIRDSADGTCNVSEMTR
jgi:hypothetical protein